MQTLSSGLSDGSNTLGQINNLLTNAVNLWDKVSDTFINKIEQKEKRIGQDPDYLKQVEQSEMERKNKLAKGITPKGYLDEHKPMEKPVKVIECSQDVDLEQLAEIMNDWFLSTISNMGDEMTLLDLKTQWKENQVRMSELMHKFLIKIQSAKNEANKENN